MKHLPRIYFRADAGNAVGLGHAARCLSMARAWRDRGGESIFLLGGGSRETCRRVRAAGIPTIPIRSSHPRSSELRKLRSLIRADEGSWIVIDGYHFDEEYLKGVRSQGWRSLVLDDTDRLRKYDADVVLNQNPGAETLLYAGACGALVLAGARYTLVSPEFLRPRTRRRSPARHVLITFGGSSTNDITRKVLRALERHPGPRLAIEVVLGPAQSPDSAIRAHARASRHDVAVAAGIRDMPARMRRADIIFTAGGVTSREAAAAGVPAVVGHFAKNQEACARELERAGAALNAGHWKKAGINDIARIYARLSGDEKLRGRMSRAGRSLVDGKGARRILDMIQALSSSTLPKGALRTALACPADALAVWRLANEPSVRRHSFSRERIPLLTHRKWFRGVLSSRDQLFLLYKAYNVLAGVFRYERKTRSSAEVHFGVHPAFRGKGLGTSGLKTTWGRAMRTLTVRRVFGSVIVPNPASERAFIKAGYRRAGTRERGGYLYCEFEKKSGSRSHA